MMGLKYIFLIIFVLASVGAAHIHASNTYYAMGGTSVHEDISLQNVDYVKVVDITPEMIEGSGGGSSKNGSSGAFFEAIKSNSDNHEIGAYAGACAERLEWGSHYLAGNPVEDNVEISYMFKSGIAGAGCCDPHTTIREGVLSENVEYSSTVKATEQGVNLDGKGAKIDFEDVDTKLEHALLVTHDGKWAKTETSIDCWKDEDLEDFESPTIYLLTVRGDGESDVRAGSFVDLAIVGGNRNTTYSQTAMSSEKGPETIDGKTDAIPNAFIIEDASIDDMINLIKFFPTITAQVNTTFEIV